MSKSWAEQAVGRIHRMQAMITHEPHVSEHKWTVSKRKSIANMYRDHGQPSYRVFQLTQYKSNQVAKKGSWKLHVRRMEFKGWKVARGNAVPSTLLYKTVLPPSDLPTAVKNATAVLNAMISMEEVPWVIKE